MYKYLNFLVKTCFLFLTITIFTSCPDFCLNKPKGAYIGKAFIHDTSVQWLGFINKKNIVLSNNQGISDVFNYSDIDTSTENLRVNCTDFCAGDVCDDLDGEQLNFSFYSSKTSIKFDFAITKYPYIYHADTITQKLKDSIPDQLIIHSYTNNFIVNCIIPFDSSLYIDSVYLNKRLFTDVFLIRNNAYPYDSLRSNIKKLYIKRGIGIIGLVLKNEEIWYLN